MAIEDEHLPPSNIQTDQSPYPFWALERWIRALIAAFFSRGGGNVVWRPGAVSSGNVYGTWAEVVAAVATLNGAVTIALDVDTAPAVIPAGAWDLRPPGISGPVTIVDGSKLAAPSFTPLITIANAAVTIRGLTGLDNVAIDNQSTSDVMAPALGEVVTFYMSGTATIFQNVLAGAKAFFKSAAGTFQIFMNDFSFVTTLGGGTNALQVVPGGFIQLQIDDCAAIDTNQLSGATYLVQISATSEVFGIPAYATQAGAPTVIPHGLTVSGSTQIDGATGKSAAIPAFLTATSTIECTQRTAAGDATTVRYAALAADRVTGNPGSFKISALTAAGGGAVNAGDSSIVDWIAICK